MIQFPKSNSPRWLILLIDILTVSLSIFLAYQLRFNFQIPKDEFALMLPVIPIVVVVRIITFFIFKPFSGIIRYTSNQDTKRIFFTVFTGTVILGFGNVIRFYLIDNLYLIPISVLIIDFLLSLVTLIGGRIAVKLLFSQMQKGHTVKTNIIIYGAGESGIITKRSIDRDLSAKRNVVAFVDDNLKKRKKMLEGSSIYHTKDLERLLQKHQVEELIISIQEPDIKAKNFVIETCLKNGVKVLNVPPFKKWINGELSFNQIKKVKIDDLLGRDPINLSTDKISGYLANEIILITGAAGSIGSEIVRQVLQFNPKKVILLDQAESALYDLGIELTTKGYGKEHYEICIADITKRHRLKNVFNFYQPNIVFHAAAYKHVPLMEDNPSEAVITNVLGSKNLVDLSLEYGVNKFVLISTDKAVNPTNVMGCTKRVAEIYAQSHQKAGKTQFITTRFGNVLGSNGSVIPLFKKQIENGGPLTITHKDITRYFMTIPEACQLVLEAGSMGKGGEIFVFDMGESVKIYDLAKKMIQLSGLTLDKDINIVFTGLRPGEKLYEELLNNEENTLPTHHAQIMIGKVREYELSETTKHIEDLVALFEKQDNFKIVKKLKEIVPEYISNNSIYSELDKSLKHD